MNDTAKTPPVTIRFPADLLDALKKQASNEDRSLASLVVHFARQGLEAKRGNLYD